MAKLYWRVKRDGKWTWRPAVVFDTWPDEHRVIVDRVEEEE